MSLLLTPSKLPFEAFDYSKLNPNEFIPALKKAIENSKEELEAYKKGTQVTFEDVILPLEHTSEMVDHVSSIFFALYSAHGTTEIRAMANELSEMLTNYGSDFSLDPQIFKRVRALYEKRNSLNIQGEELRVLESYYKDFARGGALLDDEKKSRLRALDVELSKLALDFSENVLNATNEFKMEITNKDDLDGLPDSTIEAAAEAAKAAGLEGKWIFTLHFPSYMPFMEYSKKESLRKTMFMAYVNRAYKDKNDNSGLIKKIVALRDERAKLLGFTTHAHFVLEERMASDPETVTTFLEELFVKAMPVAKKETAELKAFKKELTGNDHLEPWDVPYYANLLKQKLYALDDEALRPYLKLENVVDGMFLVAKKLYGLNFIENKDLPLYHPEVKVYEVHDSKTNDYIGLLYADFFPRDTKKSGAWMTDLKDQGLRKELADRPHISIVCNFTKPTGTRPSLLTLDEVTTMFHEFGHALHGLLSKCKYRKLSGTSVYWDFVELPSQVMENWVTQKECLDLFARHYETGELIPEDYVQKIKAMNNYRQGWMTMRQLRFGFLDMAWHMVDPKEVNDLAAFEEKITARCRLLDTDYYGNISCAFSHIFAGGYSAGYYSYKWAEVLDADAFEHFTEVGIFESEVANKFRKYILEMGGTEHPMELYKRFRGKEPSVDALLRRSGLL